MELGPLLSATFAVLLSLTLSGLCLKHHAAKFDPLSWQTRAFDCKDMIGILTADRDETFQVFGNLSIPCMIPHLHDPGRDEESPLRAIFAELTDYRETRESND